MLKYYTAKRKRHTNDDGYTLAERFAFDSNIYPSLLNIPVVCLLYSDSGIAATWEIKLPVFYVYSI